MSWSPARASSVGYADVGSESLVLAGTTKGSELGEPLLSEESVLGSMFLTLIADHETVGNTLRFTLLLLAVYPKYQTLLQLELDEQLEGRSKDEWTIEKDFPAL